MILWARTEPTRSILPWQMLPYRMKRIMLRGKWNILPPAICPRLRGGILPWWRFHLVDYDRWWFIQRNSWHCCWLFRSIKHVKQCFFLSRWFILLYEPHWTTEMRLVPPKQWRCKCVRKVPLVDLVAQPSKAPFCKVMSKNAKCRLYFVSNLARTGFV